MSEEDFDRKKLTQVPVKRWQHKMRTFIFNKKKIESTTQANVLADKQHVSCIFKE